VNFINHASFIFMATKAQNARQQYGLTDELIDSLLNGSTSHEEVFGENGIYRQLTKRLFERMLGYRNEPSSGL
jgi:hypothetical protein